MEGSQFGSTLIDVILKAADWKNAGTFAKFYQRETSSVGQFAKAVLTW